MNRTDGYAWLTSFALALLVAAPGNARSYTGSIPVKQDRAVIRSITDTVTAPAGHFSNCLRTEESSELEPGFTESKTHVSDVGNVIDADEVLIDYGP